MRRAAKGLRSSPLWSRCCERRTGGGTYVPVRQRSGRTERERPARRTGPQGLAHPLPHYDYHHYHYHYRHHQHHRHRYAKHATSNTSTGSPGSPLSSMPSNTWQPPQQTISRHQQQGQQHILCNARKVKAMKTNGFNRGEEAKHSPQQSQTALIKKEQYDDQINQEHQNDKSEHTSLILHATARHISPARDVEERGSAQPRAAKSFDAGFKINEQHRVQQAVR